MKEDRFVRNLFIVAGVILFGTFLYQVRALLTPMLGALLAAYILYPVMSIGDRIGLPKVVIISLIIIGFIGVLYWGISSAGPAIKTALSLPEEQNAPQPTGNLHTPKSVDDKQELGTKVAGRLKYILYKSTSRLNMPRLPVEPVADWVADWVTRLDSWTAMGSWAKNAGQFVMIFAFVLVFSLLDGHRFYGIVVEFMPNSYFEPGIFILRKTLRVFGQYLRGLIIENMILGVLCFLFLVPVCIFTKLSYSTAFLITLIIALTNVIRIVGPIFGGLAGMGLALFVDTDLFALAGVTVVAILIQLLDNVVVLPMVMKEQIKIHPVVCLLSVVAGGMIAGVLGMMLAIPVVGGIKVVYQILTVEMKRFDMTPDYPRDREIYPQ